MMRLILSFPTGLPKKRRIIKTEGKPGEAVLMGGNYRSTSHGFPKPNITSL
jgi:hypothetical protein